MSTTDDTNVLLEDINSKFDQIIEVVGTLGDKIDRKADAEQVAEIKADIKVIKAAVTGHGTELQDHEQRISHLELQNQ